MGSERLRHVALVVWTSVGALILAWALLRVADAVRIIWLPMAFAFGLVFILEPGVQWLERKGVKRVFGAFIAFFALVGVIIAATALVYPTVQAQVAEFAQTLPDLFGGLLDRLEELADRLGFDINSIINQDWEEWLRDPANQATIQNILLGFGVGAGFLLRGITEAAVIAGLAPVLAIYVLLDLNRFKANALQLTPTAYREEASYVGGEVGTAMGSFVRGQLLVALIVGVLSSIGMWLIGLPFWLLVGIISGLLNMIPFLGPIVGGALAFLVALLNGDPWQGLWAVAIYTLIQQIDNNVITPVVQRARVHLSPFAIVIALIVGGTIAGLLGVLIAVPLTAAIRIIAGHLWRTRILGQSWQEASEAMIEVSEPPERLARLTRKSSDQSRLFDTQEMAAVNTPEQSPEVAESFESNQATLEAGEEDANA